MERDGRRKRTGSTEIRDRAAGPQDRGPAPALRRRALHRRLQRSRPGLRGLPALAGGPRRDRDARRLRRRRLARRARGLHGRRPGSRRHRAHPLPGADEEPRRLGAQRPAAPGTRRRAGAPCRRPGGRRHRGDARGSAGRRGVDTVRGRDPSRRRLGRARARRQCAPALGFLAGKRLPGLLHGR